MVERAPEKREVTGSTPVPTTTARTPTLATAAGHAVTAFGFDLFGAVVATQSGDAGNVVVSPLSVAMALAMVEPGAGEAAGAALRSVLRIDDPLAHRADMNAIARSLDEAGPELTTALVNTAYVQHDYAVRRAYLDAVTVGYGAALTPVDFVADADAVARAVNEQVADTTRGRIKDVVPPGAFDEDTRLALVNALYLKARWHDVFRKAETEESEFIRLDHSSIEVPMMRGTSNSSARGDGWVGATKAYSERLAAQFVLPDEGRFAEVGASLAAAFATLDRAVTDEGPLSMPRFETRGRMELSNPFARLGLDLLYRGGNLLGVAGDPRLVLGPALHATFLAVDEEGTEAAAATVLTMLLLSRPIRPPAVPVVLDRPFFLRIVDWTTKATLFLGCILDPTA